MQFRQKKTIYFSNMDEENSDIINLYINIELKM
jgi:hypothetical protein